MDARIVFVDCGGHCGCSCRYFLQQHSGREIEVHSFEPTPALWPHYSDLPVTLHKAAAWIDESPRDFYMSTTEFLEGGSLDANKTTGGLNRTPVQVECIDLSKWLLERYESWGDSEIHLKLDCEGAEYPLLEKLIETNALQRINRLYVDWHWHKIGMPQAAHEDMLRKLILNKKHFETWPEIFTPEYCKLTPQVRYKLVKKQAI